MYRFPNNVTGLVGLVLLLLAACSDDPGPGITLPPTLPPPRTAHTTAPHQLLHRV